MNAPLLAEALTQLPTDARCIIIDLGAIQPTTLACFSAFPCRLEIVDVAHTAGLDAAGSWDPDPEPIDEPVKRLPRTVGEPADLMLCWTYLNYFTIDQIASLIKPLADRLMPKGQLHALIESSAADMPATPQALAIDLDGSLRWPPPAAGPRRPAPRYSSDSLTACFSDYKLERSLLLANGYKEILLTRSPA